MFNGRFDPSAPNRTYNDWGVIEKQLADMAQHNGYTKAEADALLDQKADKATTYTKTETDNLLADKADADDLQQEVLARGDADQQLQTNINAKADQTALDQEIQDRTNADLSIRTDVNAALEAEAYNRQQADQTLQNNIDTKANQSDLTQEITDRQTADTLIRTDVAVSIENEAYQRVEADKLKQDKLTPINGVFINQDNEIGVLIDGTTIKLNSQGLLYACGGHGTINMGNVDGGGPDAVYMTDQYIDGGYPDTQYQLV